MTDFNDRESAEEAKYAFDQENAFRVSARRNRLLGQWAAERMDLTPAETDAYAKAVVQADFEESGDEDVIRKLLGDLTAAGCDLSEADVRAKLQEMSVEAEQQIQSGQAQAHAVPPEASPVQAAADTGADLGTAGL